jgi:hypothetical protein
LTEPWITDQAQLFYLPKTSFRSSAASAFFDSLRSLLRSFLGDLGGYSIARAGAPEILSNAPPSRGSVSENDPDENSADSF